MNNNRSTRYLDHTPADLINGSPQNSKNSSAAYKQRINNRKRQSRITDDEVDEFKAPNSIGKTNSYKIRSAVRIDLQ